MPKLKPGTIIPTPEEDRAITAAADADPDARPFSTNEWRKAKPSVRIGRPPLEQTKVQLTVRYTPEVVDYFRGTGEGWQGRMNKVLADYVIAHRSNRAVAAVGARKAAKKPVVKKTAGRTMHASKIAKRKP